MEPSHIEPAFVAGVGARQRPPNFRKRLAVLLTGSADPWRAPVARLAFHLLAWNTALILVGVLLAAALGRPLTWWFGERHPMSWVSFGLLLFIAGFAKRIGLARPPSAGVRDSRTLWPLLAVVFVYLACDDLLAIHEGIDDRLCLLFGLDRNGWADQINDAVVGLYGGVGVFALVLFWKETLRFLPAWRYFLAAAAMSLVMFVFDWASNGPNYPLARYFGERPLVQRAIVIMGTGEDILKIYAEVLFVCAFAAVLERARAGGPR
jgi:hypothetical protein